jgi:hypothetical protein
MKADRISVYGSVGIETTQALRNEFANGVASLPTAGEGAKAFVNRKRKAKL